jgi:hypothetical protein
MGLHNKTNGGPPMPISLATSDHLATLGVSPEQALQFINANIQSPAVIFGTAVSTATTLNMLGEIVGRSSDEVAAFFLAHGFDPNTLETGTPGPGQAFVPPELNQLGDLWALNTQTGNLSNAALRAQAVSAVGGEANFDMIFNPVHFAGGADGVFAKSDLQFIHLGQLAATQENLESLFFGTVINLVRRIDVSEHQAISAAADTLVRGVVADAYVDAAESQSVPDSEIPAVAAAIVLLCWNSPGTTLFDGLLGYWA